MLGNVIFLIVGIIGIILFARLFESSGAYLGRVFGLSAFIVGTFIVAPGTSSPEMFISIIAALKGNSAVAFGNVMGSNLFNPLIIGIVALITPLETDNKSIKDQCLIMFIITSIFVGMIFIANSLSIVVGTVLLLLLTTYLVYLSLTQDKLEIKRSDKNKRKALKERDFKKVLLRILLIILSIVGLYFSGDITVENAIEIANVLGISESIIAKTVLAVGTSLPELAICVVSIRRIKHDLVMSNVLMSNILNITLILGVTSLIFSLTSIKEQILRYNPFDLLAVLVLAGLVTIFAFTKRIGRFKGSIIILTYIVYTTISIIAFS